MIDGLFEHGSDLIPNGLNTRWIMAVERVGQSLDILGDSRPHNLLCHAGESPSSSPAKSMPRLGFSEKVLDPGPAAGGLRPMPLIQGSDVMANPGCCHTRLTLALPIESKGATLPGRDGFQRSMLQGNHGIDGLVH